MLVSAAKKGSSYELSAQRWAQPAANWSLAHVNCVSRAILATLSRQHELQWGEAVGEELWAGRLRRPAARHAWTQAIQQLAPARRRRCRTATHSARRSGTSSWPGMAWCTACLHATPPTPSHPCPPHPHCSTAVARVVRGEHGAPARANRPRVTFLQSNPLALYDWIQYHVTRSRRWLPR